MSTQIGSYLTTVYTFRDKYMALPGDMANATSFWGAANADPVTCRTTNSLGLADSRATCDGNGSGIIRDTGTYGYEAFRFWQHLANAGLLEGSYSGITDSGSALDATPGFNVPRAKLSNSGFSVWYIYTSSIPTCEILDCVKLDGRHLLNFGGERIGGVGSPVISPSEAWNIDTKLDDGGPATGKIVNNRSTATVTPSCTNSDSAATAQYSLNLNDKLCAIVILPGF